MAASSGLLQGAGVCAGMWRAEGLRLGAAGVRRGQGGWGKGGERPKVEKGSHTHGPHAKCLPVTAYEVIVPPQEKQLIKYVYFVLHRDNK